MVFNNQAWTPEHLLVDIWCGMIDYGTRIEWTNVSNPKSCSPKVKQKLMGNILDQRRQFGFFANILEGQPCWVMTKPKAKFVF